MKDPLDDKPRAHALLGIALDAGGNEINTAYARRCQVDKAARAELTHAWQRLRRPETRLEEELWYYEIVEEGPTLPPPPELALACPLPRLELDLAWTDLSADRARADFTEVAASVPQLDHLSGYDSVIECPPVAFDR